MKSEKSQRRLPLQAQVLGFTTLLLGLAQSFSPIQQALAQGPEDLIYGNDDRRDLYQVNDVSLLSLADSTVGLFRTSQLSAQPNQTTKLQLFPYGDAQQLCTDEPFYTQQVGAFCSGTLVAPNVILTAGHCIDTLDCNTVAFVFDFSLKDGASTAADTVQTKDVYTCKKVLSLQKLPHDTDYALVQLDRNVTDHQPVKVDHSLSTLAVGSPLVLIGHPSGLPTKIAGDAHVRSNANPHILMANTDSYGGNSGSGVFNPNTGELVGVLVFGARDFVPRMDASGVGGCMVSNHCPDEGCAGEGITAAPTFSAQIPQ